MRIGKKTGEGLMGRKNKAFNYSSLMKKEIWEEYQLEFLDGLTDLEIDQLKEQFPSKNIDFFVDKIILPILSAIKNIIGCCEAEFSIVQYIYDSCNPGLHISNNTIKFLANIGA